MAGVCLVVRATDRPHALGAKRGDLICARPFDDPKELQWGTAEGLPNFVRIYLHGVRPAKVLRFVVPEYEGGVEPFLQDGSPNPLFGDAPRKVVRKRRWRLLVNNLPLSVRNKLLASGELHVGGPTPDVTWEQVRDRIQDARTLATLGSVPVSDLA